MKDHILILGAGPAGMACAMELHKAGRNFTVVERDPLVGGLSKTFQFGEFRADHGPHRFFSKNQYLYDFIEDLLQEKWIKVNRSSHFYIDGKFYRYPIEWKDSLTTMGPRKAFLACFDYLKEKIKLDKAEPRNFEEHIVANFGRTLAEFNMLNYTEKIWGVPCTQLSTDWAQQRIRGLTLAALIKNMFLPKSGPKTLVDQFYFPEYGTGLIYETIKNVIEKTHKVILETVPSKISHAGGRITAVDLNTRMGEQTFTVQPDQLVSSIPITTFLKLLSPAPPDEVLTAAQHLKFRSQVYLFITLNKPGISNDQWMYFPDKEIPFGRISEMKNFSRKMCPSDKCSLFVEFFCWEGDNIWNGTKEELFELILPWLDKLGFVKREEVIDIYHLRVKDCYPVYDLDYQNHLTVVKHYLDQFENLRYIGRLGRFKYTNQDHSLEMGILTARGLIEGKQYDIDEVGAEKEYFEKGYVK